MARVERQLELVPVAVRDDDVALRHGVRHRPPRSDAPSKWTSPPGPNVTTSSSSRRYGSSSGSSAGTTATAPSRIPTSSSAFARATPSSEPSCSRWTGPTFVITPTSGSQIAVSSAIWPKPRIASSSTSTSVPGGAASSSSGSPISVLKFARLAATVRWGAISAAIRSFVDVLPTEPVTAITCAASSRRQARASAPSDATGCSAASTAPASPPPAASRAQTGAASTPQAPARSASAANRPPSTRSPGQRDEQVAGLDRARVDHDARRALGGAVDAAHAARRRPRRRSAGRSSASSRRRRVRRSCARAPAGARDARSASRATSTSSNGSLRPPANSCPCSWPLPAITTTSPGSASSTARAIAARRSTSRST